MKRLHQRVRLTSNRHYGSSVPPDTFGQVLHLLSQTSIQAARMCIEGRSSVRGQRPGWLERISDIRFVEISGDDDTIIHFECPTLGDAADELYTQQELPGLETLPNPALTAMDLLGGVFVDVEQRNADSERFDIALLRRISAFQKAFERDDFDSLFLEDIQTDHISQPALTRQVVETAQRFSSSIPEPRPVRIKGTLDMIRASTRSFEIVTKDGKAKGIFCEGNIEELGRYLNKEVLIVGKAIYRPSGRLLRIDTEVIEDGEGASHAFGTIPAPLVRKTGVQELKRTQNEKTGVSAFFGIWPGDESEEEFNRQIERAG